jgi:hypothetical protein
MGSGQHQGTAGGVRDYIGSSATEAAATDLHRLPR